MECIDGGGSEPKAENASPFPVVLVAGVSSNSMDKFVGMEVIVVNDGGSRNRNCDENSNRTAATSSELILMPCLEILESISEIDGSLVRRRGGASAAPFTKIIIAMNGGTGL